jgi:hypothetical protein
MIDYSLLSSLPTADMIHLGSLTQNEAVHRLQHAAQLCLGGAKNLLDHDPTQAQLASKLIQDGLTLYDLALLRLKTIPEAQRPTISVTAREHIDSPTPWDVHHAEEIEQGAASAEEWLKASSRVPLWWQLVQTRYPYPLGEQRDAFEAGFLRRLQHRLLVAKYQAVVRT